MHITKNLFKNSLVVFTTLRNCVNSNFIHFTTQQFFFSLHKFGKNFDFTTQFTTQSFNYRCYLSLIKIIRVTERPIFFSLIMKSTNNNFNLIRLFAALQVAIVHSATYFKYRYKISKIFRFISWSTNIFFY